MRLDDWMPISTTLVRERHSLRVAAAPSTVYKCLWTADFGGPIASALLGVRALPSVLSRWFSPTERSEARAATHSALTLRRFLAAGFAQLDAVPDDELVLGLTGRFWTPTGGLITTESSSFREGPPKGYAQAAWNFRIIADGAGGSELLTETRVRVAEDARRSFLAYWTIVRPFSGLLRRLMLRDIRRAALTSEESKS